MITKTEYDNLINDLKRSRTLKQKPFTDTKIAWDSGVIFKEKLPRSHMLVLRYIHKEDQYFGSWETSIRITYQKTSAITDLSTAIILESSGGQVEYFHKCTKQQIIAAILQMVKQDIELRISINTVRIRENKHLRNFLKKWREKWKT